MDYAKEKLMDIKKLAQFVMMAGLAVFGYGGFKYVDAEAKAKQQVSQKVPGDFFGFGAALNQMDAGARKQAAKKDANTFMIVGGVIIFVGFAISASSKPEQHREQPGKKVLESKEPNTWDVG